jgi:hypothetical protein
VTLFARARACRFSNRLFFSRFSAGLPASSLLHGKRPTGNYLPRPQPSHNSRHLETRKAWAFVGGLGATKCSASCAVAVKPLIDCKEQGFFQDNLFLELLETCRAGTLAQAVLQKMSAANVFLVLQTGEIVTPFLGTQNAVTGSHARFDPSTHCTELQETMKAKCWTKSCVCQ